MNKKLFSVVLIISSLFLIPLVQAGPIFDLFIRVIQTNTLSISLVNFMPGLIGKLGPIAFFIFVALFWFLIFASLKKGLESSLLSMALAYIFAFLTFVFLDHDKKVQNFLK